MSKANPTIHSTIRFGGKTYGPGAEAEFEKAASKDQITRLTDKGAISGFATAKSHPESHVQTADAPASDAAAKTTKTTAKDKG